MLFLKTANELIYTDFTNKDLNDFIHKDFNPNVHEIKIIINNLLEFLWQEPGTTAITKLDEYLHDQKHGEKVKIVVFRLCGTSNRNRMQSDFDCDLNLAMRIILNLPKNEGLFKLIGGHSGSCISFSVEKKEFYIVKKSYLTFIYDNKYHECPTKIYEKYFGWDKWERDYWLEKRYLSYNDINQTNKYMYILAGNFMLFINDNAEAYVNNTHIDDLSDFFKESIRYSIKRVKENYYESNPNKP